MRKVLWLLLTIVLVAFLPVVCLAEGAGGMDGSSFLDWESIATYGGAVALVVFIVQLLKLPLDKVWRIPTQYVVYVVSLAVLLLAQAFVPTMGGLTWDSALLCVFNAVIVSLSAMSTYTVTIGRVEERKVLTQLDDDGLLTVVTGEAVPDAPGDIPSN